MVGAYRPDHLLLQWHITERCNLRCAHCYQDSYTATDPPFQDLLAILKQFTDLLESWNFQAHEKEPSQPRIRGHLTVTGGEPFLRQDFFDLLQVFTEHKSLLSFSILTNGSLIDRTAAQRLRPLKPSFVQVSIEGSRARHDAIRGFGSYDRTVSSIRHLVKEHIRTFISFTAHRANFREFPDVVRLAQRLGAARVWADRLIPTGGGSELDFLTRDETLEFFQIMHKARARAARKWFSRTEAVMHRGLQFLVGGGIPYHCTAGDTLLAIQPNGDLYPCRRMPIRIGNVFETPLGNLYQTSDMLRALRDPGHISEGCEQCCFMHLCRGGLKCLSYALTGDPFRADPGCFLSCRTHP